MIIQQNPVSEKLISERIPYPSSRWMKLLFKSPILLYRMGLGPLIGRLFMIMTTTGRRSGQPRRTAIEYHSYKGRRYVMVGWPSSDWYKNLLADPRLTIQGAFGTERVKARRLTTDAEYHEAWDFAEKSPVLKGIMRLTGGALTRESFVAQKDRFIILTFDPTDEPVPPPLEVDLGWVLPTLGSALLVVYGLATMSRRNRMR